MTTITYTQAELKRVRDLMDDLITSQLLEDMGYNSLKEVPQNEKPALYAEHFNRMQAAGF